MIKSMTGFGRCETSNEVRKIIIEMKAVNHRYCDISIKMPKKLSFFESAMRNVMKNYIQRGKVDVFVSYEDYTEHTLSLKYNSQLAREYLANLRLMSEELGIEDDMKVSGLSRYPEVFTLEEQTVDEEALWKLIEGALRTACERFVETRIAEGENLRHDLLDKLDGMLECVGFIEQRSPEILDAYQQRLKLKVEEMLNQAIYDEARILTEVTIFADRICVDEELVRLKSHVKNMKASLSEGGGVGRKLDFIAQEMNREANTILSKANDLEISNKAIDLKTEIEKIREQIQNIE